MRAAGAFALVLFGPLLLAPAPNDLVAKGRSGAVASVEAHASDIGIAVLRGGGNAVDAAVAVFLALAVTHPQAGNLGGGGFLLVRMADGTTTSFDFREMAPARATRDMYLRADGSVDEDKAQHGALAGGVPGSPAGLVAALARFGTKPLKELAAPAIALARDGFVVDHFLARDLAGERHLARFASTREVFFKGQKPLQQGDLLVQRDLADTLTRFAEAGFDGFYKGETSKRFAAAMKAEGGLVDEADLAAYVCKEREPLRGSYRGREVISMAPPSSGGIALLQMLRMLEPHDLKASGFGSAATIHVMTEAMKRAYADRARWLGDPDFFAVPASGLVSPEYCKKLHEGFDLAKPSKVEPGRPPGAPEGDHTTHFSIVDAAGNAVACTTTLNGSFGSGLVVAGCGFLLNNEMDDFSAKPGSPNMYGLVGGKANQIEPRKRMLSSMTPTLVLENGKLRYVLGTPGGGRIINTVLQVLLNLVDHELPLDQAVAAPRVHHQWKPDEIVWERLALPAEVRAKLEAMGHVIAKKPATFCQVAAVEVRADGLRIAVQDPRSGGRAAAY